MTDHDLKTIRALVAELESASDTTGHRQFSDAADRIRDPLGSGGGRLALLIAVESASDTMSGLWRPQALCNALDAAQDVLAQRAARAVREPDHVGHGVH